MLLTSDQAINMDGKMQPFVQSKDLCFLPLALSCNPVAILQVHSQSKQHSAVQISKAEIPA